MNYLILIIVAIAGIILGAHFARKNGGLIAGQANRKAENKQKIENFLRENGKVANNDVERLLGVSDATATRYLDELENEQKVRQIGKTGNAVYYVLK